MPRFPFACAALVAFVAVVPARRAGAEDFLTAEAPVALTVSDASTHAGALPAVGAYTGNGWFVVGARVRAGMLDSSGLASVGVAARLLVGPRRAGGWLEAVAGGGVAGGEWAPVVEAGVGWDLAMGAVDVGPSARYVRMLGGDGNGVGEGGLVLVGLDVRFGRPRVSRVVAANARVAALAPSP